MYSLSKISNFFIPFHTYRYPEFTNPHLLIKKLFILRSVSHVMMLLVSELVDIAVLPKYRLVKKVYPRSFKKVYIYRHHDNKKYKAKCRSSVKTSFSCVLTQCQERKTSMILEKQVLLRINLARVIRSFPNNLRLIILLFTSGKLSRPTPNFPGVEVPVNSPQGQIA